MTFRVKISICSMNNLEITIEFNTIMDNSYTMTQPLANDQSDGRWGGRTDERMDRRMDGRTIGRTVGRAVERTTRVVEFGIIRFELLDGRMEGRAIGDGE